MLNSLIFWLAGGFVKLGLQMGTGYFCCAIIIGWLLVYRFLSRLSEEIPE